MKGVKHSKIPVTSHWRVLPITLTSQTGMPSLTTVTLVTAYAFYRKKTIHTKSSSSSSPSFLDISPALQSYFGFIVSSTRNSTPIPIPISHSSISLLFPTNTSNPSLQYKHTHSNAAAPLQTHLEGKLVPPIKRLPPISNYSRNVFKHHISIANLLPEAAITIDFTNNESNWLFDSAA